MIFLPLLLIVLFLSTTHSWLSTIPLPGRKVCPSSRLVMKVLKQQTIEEIIELRKYYKSLTEKEIVDDEKGTEKEKIEGIELILQAADALHKIERDLRMFEETIENPTKDRKLKDAALELKKEYLIIRKNLESELNYIFRDEEEEEQETEDVLPDDAVDAEVVTDNKLSK
jgi:hypothetical protein